MSTELRDVAEHQAVVAGLVAPTDTVDIPVEAAIGMALAQDCPAPADLPGFDNSAMDGYAVRAADVAGATREQPVVLTVAGDVPAGAIELVPLAPATAQRIMTGAAVPPGADAVVQVEATDGGTELVAIHEPREGGTHIRRAGSDLHAGETALPAGTALGPAQVALLAALGIDTVQVRRRLRALVLSTGSELVEPGRPLLPGQIHDANGVMLAAALTAAGADPVRSRFVADDVDEFLAVLDSHRRDVDLVLTSGGVSAGAYEVVKDALGPRGLVFDKVAMQPGMPQGAGSYEGTPVITLPGNPVSAMVSFEVFVRPALRAAMGFAQVRRPVVRATLVDRLDSPAGKRQFRRGVLDHDTGRVALAGPASSHHLRWLANSNCLIDLDADATAVEAGATVDVWPLD